MRKLLLAFLFLASQAFGAFTYHRALTPDPTKCGACTSVNFPALVNIADATFGSHVQSASGFDIIFTSDSGGTTKIPWEIASFNKGTGVLEAWVKPAIVNTVFYIFYGDATITTAQNTGAYAPAAVWDANYRGVWHLGNGSTLALTDSTSNGFNLANVGAATAGTGKVGGAVSLNGTTQALTLTASVLAADTTPYTVSAWAKAATTSAGSHNIFQLGSAGYSIQLRRDVAAWNLYQNNGGNVQSTQAGGVSAGAWQYITGSWDTFNVALYVNGALAQSTGSGTRTNNGTSMSVGNATSTAWWDGSLDEVRLSNIARSADWVLAEYNNQNAPGNIGTPGFLTFGAEVGSGGPPPPPPAVRHRVIN